METVVEIIGGLIGAAVFVLFIGASIAEWRFNRQMGGASGNNGFHPNEQA